MKKPSAIIMILLFLLFSCVLKQPPDQPSVLVASFFYLPASPVAGQPVQFTDTSTGSPTSREWKFGDSAVSTALNPNHSYAATGTYEVTLTIRAGTNSDCASRTISIVPEAVGYYIDTSNPNANDSNPGTESLPWKTVTKANQTLRAGDTVYIKSGTYTAYIAPENSGTASNRITYRSYGSDVVIIRDASYGILLDGKTFITVEGINFYNLDRFMYLLNSATNNIIAYCNFDQMRNRVEWAGSRIIYQSSHNWVHHCRFSKFGGCFGPPPDGTSSGVVLEIGNEGSTPQNPDYSNYNLIEDNIMYHGGHHVLGVMGQFNVIRNNYLHNEGWSQGRGQRNLYMNGNAIDTGWNLIEGNRISYAAPPCSSTSSSGASICSNHNIFRKNRFYFNSLAGLAFGVTSSYLQDSTHNRVYNNTFFRNAQSRDGDPGNAAVFFAAYGGSHVVKYNIFKNNLYYGHPVKYGVYQVSLADQTFANEFDGDAAGDPRFVNATAILGDPLDITYPDFHLNDNSPCIDKGSFLTTISSSSGSGTTFQVEDAGYFIDDWGIPGVDGDEIQIVGTLQKARISHVDYGTNTITVNSALTWTQNQGVALAYVGAAPDVGAHEYGSQPVSVKK